MNRVKIFTSYLSEKRGGIENMSFNLFKKIKEYTGVKAYSLEVEGKKFKEVYYSKFEKLKLLRALDFLVHSFFDRIKNGSSFNIALTWKFGVITYLHKKITGDPYIVYTHGNEIHPKAVGSVQRILINKVFNESKRVIANSEYSKDLVTKNYGNFDTRIIHPGIDYREFEESDENKKSDKKILFSVSHLIKRKGIGNTIKAINKLKGEYPEIRYRIAGKGPYRNKLEDIAKKEGVRKKISFLGFIDEEEKHKMYEECDLFVMPSRKMEGTGDTETFGIVYLEANMHGKFVIAGNCGGISDAVKEGETGLMVNGESPEEIAQGIKKFFEKHYKQEGYKEKCKKWAKEHDWDKIINSVLKNMADT